MQFYVSYVIGFVENTANFNEKNLRIIFSGFCSIIHNLTLKNTDFSSFMSSCV